MARKTLRVTSLLASDPNEDNEIPLNLRRVVGERKLCRWSLIQNVVFFLQKMYKGIGNSTPWLILAGSGGVADILVTLMNRGCWDVDSVQELLLDTFPNAPHHSTDISNWVKLVRHTHTHTLARIDPKT